MKVYKALKCDDYLSIYCTTEEEAKKFCATEEGCYRTKAHYYAIDFDNPDVLCSILRRLDHLEEESTNNRHRHNLP